MNARVTRSKGLEGTAIRKLVDKNPLLFEYESPNQDGLASRSSISFFRDDLEQLKASNFLNDTIISFFMQYHWDHETSKDVKSYTHVFNSFFFSKLRSIKVKQKNDKSNGLVYGDNSFACTQRWFKGVRIFDKDFLIMPICDRDHWLLSIICYPASQTSALLPSTIPDDELREPAVIVLNSFFGHAPSVKKTLNKFLTWQWHKERGVLRKFTINWGSGPKNSIKLIFPMLPQQKNNYDCGVYMLNFFYCFLKDPRGCYIRMFRQKDMTSWFEENKVVIRLERRRMMGIISRQHELWVKSTRKIKELDNVDDDGGEEDGLMKSERQTSTPSVELMETNNDRSTLASVIIIH